MMNDMQNKQRAETVWIIEFRIQSKQALPMQALLQGEDGLAVVRSFTVKEDSLTQQFWTTLGQKQELHDWLQQLPEKIKSSLEILREYAWREEI